jgi:hypothetical protein
MRYVVDGSNLIIEVDGEWDVAAAQAAGGHGAMRAQVVGLPLERFIAGDATKMFVRAALDAARLVNQTRALPYRCDSPIERRRFEMVISPLGDGHVEVDHRIVSVERRVPRSTVQRPIRAAGWRCSQCLSVRWVGSTEWQEAEVCNLLAQDVCPGCAARLFGASISNQG